VAVVVVGVVTLDSRWTTILAIGLMIANMWHLTTAWRRVVRRTPAGTGPT
jgi:hypothetical protein